MNRLMLCSGQTRREGWCTLDSNPAHAPYILATIPPLPDRVKGDKWDEIELIHGITSFYPWESEQLLCEIYSVLKPGGKVVLEQPNLDYVVAYEDVELRWIFGDPSLKDPAHMNKWAYTPRSLHDLLSKCGFSQTVGCTAQHHNPTRDFRMEAYK